MDLRPEPDDVDFRVGDVESDPRTSAEIRERIREHRQGSGRLLELEEAEKILAAIGINLHDRGMEDADALLEHWRRCVADLAGEDAEDAGTSGDGHATSHQGSGSSPA